MGVFERAGYKNYADNVKRIAAASDSDTDYSSCSDGEYPLPQPPTYLPQEPFDTHSSFPLASPEEPYMLIHSTGKECLPNDGNTTVTKVKFPAV